MKENDYPAQVAELVETAFQDIKAGMDQSDPEITVDQFNLGQSRLLAAQAIATLGAARETRIQSLLMVATAAPADGRALNPELTEAAYGAALTMLGLVDEDDNAEDDRLEFLARMSREEARADDERDGEDVERAQAYMDSLDNDPADADLGDLGGRA